MRILTRKQAIAILFMGIAGKLIGDDKAKLALDIKFEPMWLIVGDKGVKGVKLQCGSETKDDHVHGDLGGVEVKPFAILLLSTLRTVTFLTKDELISAVKDAGPEKAVALHFHVGANQWFVMDMEVW